MKVFLLGLALLSSVASFAVEKCEIQGYGSVFLANGDIFKNATITDIRSITREKNWEECYKKAIKLSKDYSDSTAITISGKRVSGGSADTMMFLYFDWSFNDSSIPFLDTSGKVTKHTDKYESYAQDTDLRYFSDGRLFE